MSTTGSKRAYTRIAALPDDARVELIREAFGACETKLRCKSREHIRDGDYKDPERLIGLLDDLVLHCAKDAGLLQLGHALNMAVEMTVFDGTGAPKESIGETHAAESLEEGQANAAMARLFDAPKSPGQLRAAIAENNDHITALVRQRLVLMRELRAVEASH